MACHQRLRLQDQILMSLERHVQDRQEARERGGAPGMERGVDAARPGQAWGPTALGHPELTSPREAQSPAGSSRPCPLARPLDPRKAVKSSQSLSRGVRSGLPKPCSPRGAGSTAAWRPQTHHLPCRDSLTGPGLPRLRLGAAASARSSLRVLPLRLPRPLRTRRSHDGRRVAPWSLLCKDTNLIPEGGAS